MKSVTLLQIQHIPCTLRHYTINMAAHKTVAIGVHAGVVAVRIATATATHTQTATAFA